MALKNLTESSNLGLTEVIQNSATGFIDIKPLILERDIHIVRIEDFQAPGKMHIGMLSISLIAGVAYGGYVGYMNWREKSVLLSHIRNLVIALTCRTFFSILFEGVIMIESPLNADGGNALLSFECICLNLVHAFWLVLTLYIHARVQRNFNNEPSLTMYVYGLPGIAVYFAFVWIFAMEGTHSSQIWWIIYHFIPFYQWVVNALRLLFLLAQLALLVDIGRMMMVKTTDNDSVSLFRKVAVLMGVLVLLFWLQFGLSVGRPPLDNIQPYLYFYYLIDGTQCLFVCIVLFFFNMWVPMILDKLPNIVENEEMARTTSGSNEVLLRKHYGKNIVTVDSIFMTEESKRWTNKTSDSHEDVVYSSVVKPENLQKTIDLYKRLNVIPNDKVTVVEGEEFYDCDLRSKRSDSGLLKHIQNLESDKPPTEANKVNEKIVKKNAFYSSKYLIVDCKEKDDIPTYLQTRPWSYTPGMETPEEKVQRKPSKSLETLGSDELVEKWLKDHSDDMEGVQKASADREKPKNIDKAEISQIVSKMEDEGGSSFTETIVSTVNSVIMGTLFPSDAEDNLNEENLEDANSTNEQENSNVEETNTSNDQNGKATLNKEQRDAKECEKIIQNTQGDLKPKESIQDTNENECPVSIIEEIKELNDEIQDVKHEEKPKTSDNSNNECERTPPVSVPPIQNKKILTPPNDFLSDIETKYNLKDQANPQITSEMEVENPPETFPDHLLTANGRGNENPQDSDNKAQNISEAMHESIKYSDLLAFRAERDKSENETDKDRKMKTNESKLLTGNTHQKLSHLPITEVEDSSESFI